MTASRILKKVGAIELVVAEHEQPCPVNHLLRNDPKIRLRRLRRTIFIADGHSPKPRNGSTSFDKFRVAVGDSAASRNQAGDGRCDLFECAVAGDETCIRHSTRMNHPRLQLGEFGERCFDAFFDRANLGGDFVGGVLNLLLTHDWLLSARQTSRSHGFQNEKETGFG